MMRMYFWWGSNLGDFFLPGFSIRSAGGVAAVCAGLAALAIIYESMKLLKTRLRMKVARESRMPGLPTGHCQNESSQLLASARKRFGLPDFKSAFNLLRELMLHLLDGIIGYIVMLSVMLYNGYMFIAVILGAAIGHFIFGHMSRKINMENVQARTTAQLCISTCPDQGSYSSILVNRPNASRSSSEDI